MLEPFTLPFVQEGLIEILLLSVAAGLAGTWIVLRGLSFYSHAIGTASFPGLVLADGLGFSVALGAFGMAALFAVLSTLARRTGRTAGDSATALILVGFMAAGIILASDVFGSGANVDTLLFGSLLAIGTRDLILAGVAAAICLLAITLLSQHWLARGFDSDTSTVSHPKTGLYDFILMTVVAFTVVASLNAVGALLVAALVVIPAATARMLTRRVFTMQVAAVILVALQGSAGLWLSVKTDAPPGATIAVISGLVFSIVVISRRLSRTGFRKARLPAVAIAALALAGFSLTGGCGASDRGGDGKLKVAATTTQVADFVSEVGGDRVEVTRILQPNTDPHEYEPRPSDIASVANADLVFSSGDHLDDWIGQVIDDSGSKARLVELGDDIPFPLHEDDAGGGEIDPHWWHDPRNVEAVAGVIGTAMGQADPGRSASFRRSANRYAHRVGDLDARIQRCIAAVPAPERVIVTDHDAFGYFTRRYGITSVGAVIPALTTEAQPSAGDLANLEDKIKKFGVKAVFAESSVSAKLAEAIARDTGADTGYTLYGDTLGPEGSGADTWIGMERSNADNLVRGMTGDKRGCDPGER